MIPSFCYWFRQCSCIALEKKQSHFHYRKFSSFSQKEKVGKNNNYETLKIKWWARIRFLHFWTHFLGCKYSGKAQTKPHTFFGWASAQQRISMFDFSFTACQPDLNSFKRKLNPSLRSARKAAATDTKPRLPAPSTCQGREGSCCRSDLPGSTKRGHQPALCTGIKHTGKRKSQSFYVEKIPKGYPALLHKISSS